MNESNLGEGWRGRIIRAECWTFRSEDCKNL